MNTVNEESKPFSKGKKNNIKRVVSTDVAVNDVISFLKAKNPRLERRNKLGVESVKEEYIDVIEYVEDGLITFDDNFHPTLTLRKPLFEGMSNDENVIHKINFRNRVKAGDKTRVMNGVDVDKKKGDYILRLVAFICGLSYTEVGELEGSDFDVINQIVSVF